MKKGAVAFYNTENFFDTINDPEKLENEYSPIGRRKWTPQRYQIKVGKISSVISEIGKNETGEPPIFIGLAEIENDKVLTDLIQSEHLLPYGYDYIHYDSLDERGVDTAILYRKEFVFPIHSEPMRTMYYRADGISEDYTRDVLYVQFKLGHQLLHVLVAHLPSRRDLDVNRNFRNTVMQEIREKIDEILFEDPKAHIILMGDMNGNPNDMDATNILHTIDKVPDNSSDLFNPMMNFSRYEGSLKHEGRWILFDQIIFSKGFFEERENKVGFESAHIYNDRSVQEWDRRFKGSPFRTYAGTKYLGGYSDHFPVFAIINY
jgi:endonuclease/exonuclease/phosphatase family metal-dependent hydrolase